MKTISTSNWRPLDCTLCALLLCIAALWALPENAYAQTPQSSIVGKYNATTGAAIDANLITGLPRLVDGQALAVSDSDLFVADVDSGKIGEYNATTGAAINANFILGLNGPPRARGVRQRPVRDDLHWQSKRLYGWRVRCYHGSCD